MTDQSSNFDSEFLNREKCYYTLTFVYVVQELDETIFFAYDTPYTYSHDLFYYMKNLNF